jgi:hypothetical protein
MVTIISTWPISSVATSMIRSLCLPGIRQLQPWNKYCIVTVISLYAPPSVLQFVLDPRFLRTAPDHPTHAVRQPFCGKPWSVRVRAAQHWNRDEPAELLELRGC